MSDQFAHGFDSDADRTPLPAGKLSSNGQWIFGSLYAGLVLIGFVFGVVTGAHKPKPPEVAEGKKDGTDKPADKGTAPKEKPPEPKAPLVLPKEKQPETKEKPTEPMEPAPKPKEPDPKPKEPDPKPKPPEPKPPEPKKIDVKQVAFKEVQPLFTRYCGNCHGSVKPKKGVDLSSYAKATKGDNVKPNAPDKSPLYLTLVTNNADEKMPPEGSPQPTAAEIKLIHDWIASGAKPRRTVRRRHPRRA